MPALKTPVAMLMRNQVVNEIKGPRCNAGYVEQTASLIHPIPRAREKRRRSSAKFDQYNAKLETNNIKVIA